MGRHHVFTSVSMSTKSKKDSDARYKGQGERWYLRYHIVPTPTYLFWTCDADTAMARTASDNLENKDLRIS
jgi:hypothetical protein